jgi:hypothetical protein
MFKHMDVGDRISTEAMILGRATPTISAICYQPASYCPVCRVTMNKCDVTSLNGMNPEQLLEMLEGQVRSRKDHQPARFLVNPVDHKNLKARRALTRTK